MQLVASIAAGRLPLLPLVAVILCADPRLECAADAPASTDETARQLHDIYLSGDYFALEKQLGSLDPHDPRHGFFEGQLEAAFLQDEPAQAKLRAFLALPGMSDDWRKEAWLTLAETETSGGNYDAAASDATHALEEHSIHLDPEERSAMEKLLEESRALHGIPPQSRSDQSGVSAVNATWHPCQGAPGGWLFADYRVNGLKEAAILDTGASYNVATESFAQHHGLHLLPDQIHIRASTGRFVSSQTGIADEVQIGQMSFQHVVFCICKDADVNFLPSGCGSIIGFSLIFALGYLRVSPGEGHMEIGLPSNPDPMNLMKERNLAFHQPNLLARLKCQDKDVLFQLDTGSNYTCLYDGFGQRFPEAMSGSTLSTQWIRDLSGSKTLATVTIPQLALGVENRSVLLHNVLSIADLAPYHLSLVG